MKNKDVVLEEEEDDKITLEDELIKKDSEKKQVEKEILKKEKNVEEKKEELVKLFSEKDASVKLTSETEPKEPEKLIKNTQKKKLLIATDNFLPRWDGVARFLKEIIPPLTKKYDITVLAPRFFGSSPDFKDVNIVRIPLSGFKVADYQVAKLKRRQIKELVKKSDIVWTQTIGTIGILGMWYAKRYKKPLLSYVHSIEWELFSKSLKRWKKPAEYLIKILIPFLYNKCTLIMIPYAEMGEILRKRFIFSKKEVVHLGTNVEKFSPPSNKRDAKQEIGIEQNKFLIGYIGRIGREKNIETLYEAFRQLNSEFENTKLIIVGEGLPLKFENMKDIICVGATNRVVKYYRALDVYVLPSLTETTSLTTMEAMSCGVPVVVTPVGYLKEYLQDKKNGMFFPVQNHEKLALILKKLLKDTALRSNLGRAARATILQKYTWEKTAKEIEEILGRY